MRFPGVRTDLPRVYAGSTSSRSPAATKERRFRSSRRWPREGRSSRPTWAASATSSRASSEATWPRGPSWNRSRRGDSSAHPTRTRNSPTPFSSSSATEPLGARLSEAGRDHAACASTGSRASSTISRAVYARAPKEVERRSERREQARADAPRSALNPRRSGRFEPPGSPGSACGRRGGPLDEIAGPPLRSEAKRYLQPGRAPSERLPPADPVAPGSHFLRCRAGSPGAAAASRGGDERGRTPDSL